MFGLIFERTLEGATIGGMIGTAIGGILVVATAPVSVPVMAFAGGAAVTTLAAGEIGTLVGAGLGFTAGTAETIIENNQSAHTA
ncbi:MAG: hypothetical protein CVU99_06790 [Firmicutes bacterium HGW-Firmicutes-4]|jgi:hypothetical protein|nr:MAG: hypothetical protein CVU99_06790 [Firmicutes bacterium HGW-Firmicutes-4]